MTKEKTCTDRVEENLKGRVNDLRKLWKAYCDGDEDVDGLGSIYEYGLAFDYVAPETFDDQNRGYFRYQISYGGPSDEFRFYAGPDFVLYEIEYWFLDWFDGAKITLQGEDFSLLTEIFEWFHECGTTEIELKKAMNL
jgi:hypothetical protein